MAEIKFFDKQIQAYEYLTDNVTNELLYGGGARGGKSWFGCTWQFLSRFSKPGSAGMVARAELKKLKETTLITFFKVAKAYGWSDYFTFNAQENRADFKNGSRIFFTAIDYMPSDPEFDRLGSYDLTDYFLDEAQQIHSKAISVLKGRTSVLVGEGWRTIPKALYTCNPKRNWIYSDFVRPHKDGSLEQRRKFIAALPADNPHCPPEYIANLMTADKVTKERLLFGNFEYDDDPSVLCEQDAIYDLFSNDHIQPTGTKRISADLAMQGRDKFIAGLWDGLVCHIKLDQGKSTGKSIEQDLRNLMTANHVGHSQVIADSDGLGNYLSSYLDGIKTFHGNGKSNVAEYQNIKSECAYKLAELINDRKIKIVCTPEQKQAIIEELGVLKRDKVDNDEGKKRIISKEAMKELINRSPDYLDMMIMGMWWHTQHDSLLSTNQLRYFEPAQEIKKDFTFCYSKTPEPGGDTCAIVAVLSGSSIYIDEVIYNTDGIDANGPRIVDMIERHGAQRAAMEANFKFFTAFGNNVREAVKKRSPNCLFLLVNNTVNKHTRILAQSSFIRANFVFRKDWQTCSKEYRKFMVNLTSYRMIQEGEGKADHDDAPDGCSGVAAFYSGVFKHLWQYQEQYANVG